MATIAGWMSRSDLEDAELVARYHSGDELALEVLMARYRRFALSKARTYFLVGADSDDIAQEGLIGLFKAIRDFRSDRQSSFRAFAELCITRQIITAIKTATRNKHQALNQYVSISGGTRDDPDGGERPAEERLGLNAYGPDPADVVVSAEGMDALRMSMKQMLSSLEVDVLRLYVEGKSYQEISVHLGRHVKSIDNALQRIKRKVDLHLVERSAAEVLAGV
ncbi:MAG: RNA polymerase sporulation sigma factor SigH [Acidimicrobiales bacterium]